MYLLFANIRATLAHSEPHARTKHDVGELTLVCSLSRTEAD